MNNKQVLVSVVLESTNDLRSIFVGHIHFKKLLKFRKFIKIFHCCMKPFEFHNFSEIFYCGMTRLRNTSLGVFIQCQYTRTILRNKNLRQNLFKKHSKLQNLDEICCCGMTWPRNTNLDVFIQLRQKNMGQSLFKKHSKFLNFDEIFFCGVAQTDSGRRFWIIVVCVDWQSLFKNPVTWRNMGTNDRKF